MVWSAAFWIFLSRLGIGIGGEQGGPAGCAFADFAQLLLGRLVELGFAGLGLREDSVRVDRGQHAFGNLRESLALGRLHDFSLHLGIEAALQADEASGERFDRGHFGGAKRGGIEEFFKADGGFLFQRPRFGQHPFADAHGIDDQVAGLAFDAGIDLLHLGVGHHAHAAPFHLLEEVLRRDAPHEEDDFQRLDVRAGGDHVHGDGDAREVAVAKGAEDFLG